MQLGINTFSFLILLACAWGMSGPVLAQQDQAPSPGRLSPPSLDTYQEQDGQQGGQADALPDVTRLRIKTENFDDYVPKRSEITIRHDPQAQTQEQIQQEIRQEAFDAAITGLFPLTPDEIRTLLEKYDETNEAVKEPVDGYPQPEVGVKTVSLDPGAMPAQVKTAVGYVTTVNVLDTTGAPWPIQDVTWAGDFEIVQPEEGGHIIRIIPLDHHAYGNMSIRLLTLKTPVTLSLRVGHDTVHYRMDVRIPEFGPFAEAPLIDGSNDLVAGNETLTTILDGVPPQGAVRLAVSGVDGRTSAYVLNGMTYVRTPLTLLSPGWMSSVSSADGMNVYALNETPVLLLSDEGKFQRARLSEKKDLFDE